MISELNGERYVYNVLLKLTKWRMNSSIELFEDHSYREWSIFLIYSNKQDTKQVYMQKI
ncbi:hypothetical protein FHS16_005985 [Paenibacillus endophyticus]|uniref:Uncharacterized protein n=1 Tax=Paenibacillus endophyticus TaxID=1294268 RepID=A0A7W5CFC3_9BACL|nr:hypothetical protein [Paenibacillus endophyticus]